jgi:hypothetical protein
MRQKAVIIFKTFCVEVSLALAADALEVASITIRPRHNNQNIFDSVF